MILTHPDLVNLICNGVIDADLDLVNGTSIDITLGSQIMVEHYARGENVTIDISNGETPKLHKMFIPEEGYELKPNQFALAHSEEFFNIPNGLSAEYMLKSSLARCGLEHLKAGWIDPTWSGNLTLELKNCLQGSSILLRKGMRIGQIVFYDHKSVPAGVSYRKRGKYNASMGVVAARGDE